MQILIQCTLLVNTLVRDVFWRKGALGWEMGGLILSLFPSLLWWLPWLWSRANTQHGRRGCQLPRHHWQKTEELLPFLRPSLGGVPCCTFSPGVFHTESCQNNKSQSKPWWCSLHQGAGYKIPALSAELVFPFLGVCLVLRWGIFWLLHSPWYLLFAEFFPNFRHWPLYLLLFYVLL